ncbi:LysR family transcriptional regulator [Serratia sp. M24T3]|uniref:LysR family transcriptional regulator n=1 Tax=Serratia sp. M24T3 TaxID=932213 RepID=UPI00025BAEFB|nr:LysR family transcriptional regulator [Serratia sp. M24T3]EIC86225.1 LysR family transcriptional regulator [Serratia sp. M24T3]
MDNLGDIRLFVETANLGGLSAAGRRLGLSPAAASARLVKLEAELNTRLFERTTRQLRLTEEGSLYLAHCIQALAALDDARAALLAGRTAVMGKIRIAATSDFGRRMLKKWLDEFGELYPQVQFALVLADSLSNLLQDDLDLAIRFDVPPDSSMVARKLAPNRRVLCASPSFIATHGVPANPGELDKFQCIVLCSTNGIANEWRFTQGQLSETYVVPSALARETNDGAVAREWAVEGKGIAMKSLWDIQEDLRSDRLCIVMPEWRTPELPVHAMYQRSRYMAPRVRALLDFLIARFADENTALESLLLSKGYI